MCLKHEGDKGTCRTYRQPGVTGLHALCASFATVASAVQAANFS
jgi:hypothetical protein